MNLFLISMRQAFLLRILVTGAVFPDSAIYSSASCSSISLPFTLMCSSSGLLLALDLVKNVQVRAILGPQTSMEANFLINLANEAQVPIISFSATSPSLISIRNPYFFQASQDDSSQVKAISAIIKAFGWREAIPIYVHNEYGQGIIASLTNALHEIDVQVPYHCVIPPNALDDQIIDELYKLNMTLQTRVFIVHLLPLTLGSRLFIKAKEIGMMSEGSVWIVTNSLTDLFSSLESRVVHSMQGVLGVRSYVPTEEAVRNLRVQWKRQVFKDNPSIIDAELSVFGIWAYDAAFALAYAVEKVWNKTVTYFDRFQENNILFKAADLSEELSNLKFKGLTGDCSLLHGQFNSSAFQIVNVNGDWQRSIGFWTPQAGLSKQLNFTNNIKNTEYSTNKSNLESIIWPGDSIVIPKGWHFPEMGRTWKIGVPSHSAYPEFINLNLAPNNNTKQGLGFSIELFNTALKTLSYNVQYKFIPSSSANALTTSEYDDMVYQVYLGNFDAVVGDTTIRANRSLYVDFTFPYTEPGVMMVVPIKGHAKKSAWIFFKPLTWELWVTIVCFFIFIGFVVWVLEHQINEDFRGPPSHQIGTSLWFSFSTMILSHREKVRSNTARLVVGVWIFVMLILTESYSASLSSFLTIQNLQPTITDINQLLVNGDTVGYMSGSFVNKFLVERGFSMTRLRSFRSATECHELLLKGSANGGISAAIDETPYIKQFVAKYCYKYVMVGPVFTSDGFGFVFRKGSPLAADVSAALLRMKESGQMKLIEDKWFSNQQENCSYSDPTTPPSYSLGLESFWVLFCVAGFVSSLGLIIFVLMFLGKHKHVLLRSDSNASMWRRIKVMLETFDHKEMSSGTHRNDDLRHGNNGIYDIGGIKDLPINNCPSSSALSHLPISEAHATTSTAPSSPVASADIELIIPNEAQENM